MNHSDQGLQNWTGGTLKTIKLIGMNSRFAKICIKAQEQKWLKNGTIWQKKISHFCSCAFEQIFANLEFTPINIIVFKVPPVQFWSPWSMWFTWASWGLACTNLTLWYSVLYKKLCTETKVEPEISQRVLSGLAEAKIVTTN